MTHEQLMHLVEVIFQDVNKLDASTARSHVMNMTHDELLHTLNTNGQFYQHPMDTANDYAD